MRILHFVPNRRNMDGHCNRMCQCGCVKAKKRIFIECRDIYTHVKPIVKNANILVDEGVPFPSELRIRGLTHQTTIILFWHLH